MSTLIKKFSFLAVLLTMFAFAMPQASAQEYYFDRTDSDGSKFAIWYNESGDNVQIQLQARGTWYKCSVTYSDRNYDYGVEYFSISQDGGTYKYELLVDWNNDQITLIRPNGTKAAYFLRG